MPVQEFTPEELKAEEWRDVVGYEGIYQVSSLGRVKRVGHWRIRRQLKHLTPSVSSKGYISVCLSRGRKKTQRVIRVHRLVATAFLGPEPEGKEVNHIDTNRTNARLSNLEYVTHDQNMKHAARLGRMNPGPRGPNPNRQGEKSAAAKLTDQNVIDIRHAILSGVTGNALAKQYGVTSMSISMIKSGKSWGHLSECRDEVSALGSWKTIHITPRRCGR